MMKFSRQSRLLKPAEFKWVFQQATRSSDEYFRMLARPNEIHRHRLGMAISRKSCATAVGRNRIKRIVRESFRNQLKVPESNRTLDIVVMATSNTVTKNNKELSESLLAHWQKLIGKAETRQAPPRIRR